MKKLLRIDVYTNQTKPLIDFYNERGLILDIDGAQPIDETFDAIIGALERD